MLTIRLPPNIRQTMVRACRRAGTNETGGMLFGEHVGEDDFRVLEATVAGEGYFASFVRSLAEGRARLEAFFRRTGHEYQRFNYLGEWHSHPSFALHPSTRDDATMFVLVNDSSVGALFAVSLIVKLAGEGLDAEAFIYFPAKSRASGTVVFENLNGAPLR